MGYLDKTELLESHCQLVLHYAQQGEWRGAQKWLNALHQIFPDNRYVDYTQAHYHCLRVAHLSAPPLSLLKVAQTEASYASALPELKAELEAAYQALELALTEPALWESVKHNPDLAVLQQYDPEAWALLASKIGQDF